MTVAHWSKVDTFLGPFTVVADSDGAVLASGWTDDVSTLLDVVSPSLRPDDARRKADLGAITDAVTAYHQGEFGAVDAIAVRQSSGPFLTHAWDVLRKVPPGEPISYSAFADLAGRPGAVRAAASACARNAAALFVPCHRIVRTDGTLGGFRWSLDTKRTLLTHETP